MTLQLPPVDPKRSAVSILAEESERISEWSGISETVASCCLERLVGTFAGHLLADAAALGRALHHFPLCLLNDALISLPKGEAVRLITEEDPMELAKRIRTVEWLLDDDTPFYTLDELVTHAHAFRSYLKEHRNYLVRTGLPPRTFRDCRWLYINLARLYDTRATTAPWPPDEFTLKVCDLGKREPYTWVRSSADERNCSRSLPCRYQDADFLTGLNSEDARFLEMNRKELFDVKVDMLDLVIQAARKKNIEKLWTEFRSVLRNRFNNNDVSFFFKMDRFYIGTDAYCGIDSGVNPKMIPGGLTNCIEIVGHVEKEVRIGTLNRTKKAMPPDMNQLLNCIQARTDSRHWVYFDAIRTNGNRQVLNALLRQLSVMMKDERTFWDEFRDRIACSLPKEFKVPATIASPVHSSAAGELFSQQLDQCLERGDVPAPLTSVSRPTIRSLDTFASMEELQWAEVAIEFVSETDIVIKAREKCKCFSSDQLGFKDGAGEATGVSNRTKSGNSYGNWLGTTANSPRQTSTRNTAAALSRPSRSFKTDFKS